VVPFLAVIFAFYAGEFLPFGYAGVIGGALVGFLWALLLGFSAERLMLRVNWSAWLANASVGLGIVTTGLLIGAGYMYMAMTGAALDEPSMTYAVLSALMKPAVPYYIVLNSALELFLVALVVFWNRDTDQVRRTLISVGVMSYFAMRVWTYFVHAEMRLEISQHTLSAVDVEWFRRTLTTDYRIVLNIITHVCFILAAFIPVRLFADGEM
jgi:hypothetical protein